MAIIESITNGLLSNAIYDFVKAIRPRGFFACRKAIRRIKEEGIIIFYPNREVFTKDKGNNIGASVSKAHKEVCYVGYWLLEALQSQNLRDKILEMVNQEVRFTICMVSPESPYLENYAEQVGEDKATVQKQIVNSFNTLTRLRDGLQVDRRDKLKILAHEKFITTSFWAFDYEDENSVMQMEHKPYGCTRYYTYGFQIRKSQSNNEFFKTLLESNMAIAQTASEVKNVRLLEGDPPQVIVDYIKRAN